MIAVDFKGGGVVITGGTRGLGKAMGKQFARAGASVFLTHRWGSADEAELKREFTEAGLREPVVIESDVSDEAATRELMREVRGQVEHLEAIVSNVAFAKIVRDIDDLKRSSMDLTNGYSAWPIVELLSSARGAFGAYPRYAIGISSDGARICHPGYDLAGVAKSVLETLCRYLALRLRGDGVRVNAIRPGYLDTASARAMFGEEFIASHHGQVEEMLLDVDRVAQACVALCSGMMDSVTGQVIDVDEGWSLVSPMAHLSGKWPASFPKDRDSLS